MFYDEHIHLERSPLRNDLSTMSPMLVLPPNLIQATPLDGYRVHLEFADGLAADVDLTYLVGSGEVFEPLRDVEFFRRLRIDECGVTIEWPNEADIAPETLYNHVQRAVYEQRRATDARRA